MHWKLIANCETVKSKCEMKKSWLEIQKSNRAIIFKFISMVLIPPTIGLKMTPTGDHVGEEGDVIGGRCRLDVLTNRKRKEKV